MLGCLACCLTPMLALLGVGGGAVWLTRWVKPGNELAVGVAFGAGAMVVMAVRARLRRPGCGEACRADGSCCGARS